MQMRAPFNELQERPDFASFRSPPPASLAALPDSVKRVIIVSNVLPVRLFRTNDAESGKVEWRGEFDRESNFADGPVLSGLKGMRVKVAYVGVPNINVPLDERQAVERVLAAMDCYPVYASAKEASLHFQGVCKSVLWPAFHNIIDCYNDTDIESILESHEAFAPPPRAATPKSSELDIMGSWEKTKSYNPLEIDKCWPSHLEMMTKARRVVVALYGEGDVVWVQDYHMIMLVGMLRRALPNAPVGLFLHCPFASSEVFRCLAKRQDILDSMLAADHVGFHSFEYARHFLSICHRMLGLKYGARKGGTFGMATPKGRTIVVSCAHAGLDVGAVAAWLASPALAHLRAQCPLPASGAQIIIGIDEVEGLRGVPLKLLGLDRLLTNVPALRNGKVLLKQIGLVLDSRPDDYQRCHDEVVALVKQLNERWGPVVEYWEAHGMNLPTRLAMYETADVICVTPVRWGLCCEPLEYLLAHKPFALLAADGKPSRGGRGPGALVVSEFVACARVLPGSLRVNPWSADEIARALEQALRMPASERIARCFRDCAFLDSTSLQTWGETVLRDVVNAAAERSKADAVLGIYSETDGHLTSRGRRSKELDADAMLDAYQKSKSRVIVLDYSGTLVETTPHDVFLKTGGQARSWHYEVGGEQMQREGGCLETRDPVLPKTINALKALTRNPRNHVVVVSMDLKEELEFALKAVPGLWLIAENGYACRQPGGNEWRRLVDPPPHEAEWRSEIKALMDIYVARCNAAFAFVAPSSVSFNYMLADPELGEHCAHSLELELEERVKELGLVVELQKGALTVRLRGVDRGAALVSLAGHLATQPDFVAVFGDDEEDESAFKAALETKMERVFTVKVGLGREDSSKAESHIHDSEELTDLLISLSEVKDDAPQGSMVRSTTFERMALVTKQSLVDKPKPKPQWTANMVHSPSMGVMEDLAPAPTAIPKLVSKSSSSHAPPAAQSPPPLSTPAKNAAAAAESIRTPDRVASPVAVTSGKGGGGGKQQQPLGVDPVMVAAGAAAGFIAGVVTARVLFRP